MRRIAFAGIALVLCLAAPRPAQAQFGRLSLGVAAGRTTPRDYLKDQEYTAGPHLAALAQLSLPMLPVGFRAELAYDRMSTSISPGSPMKLVSGVVNATLSLPLPVIHPYAIGGAGYYVRSACCTAGHEGAVGFNGGLGVELKLPSLPRVFAEARYHTFSYDQRLIPSGTRSVKANLIPISVGIMF